MEGLEKFKFKGKTYIRENSILRTPDRCNECCLKILDKSMCLGRLYNMNVSKPSVICSDGTNFFVYKNIFAIFKKL